jgi:UDPglucose--hexose-1-phosphate uridylyltransferase
MVHWEQRWHPLRREWVIVAAHRQNRPWSGKTQETAGEAVPEFDPECYLCPGNSRVSGIVNDDYDDVFVFDNDHPCVGPTAPTDLDFVSSPYGNMPATGLARVVCYHPRHDLSLSRLGRDGIITLLECWIGQYEELGGRPEVNHVLVFENRGEVVGVSNPHPHCQIYATNFVFTTIENEVRFAHEHFEKVGRSLLGDMIETELTDDRRIVARRDTAVGFVPYCARWAYETYVAPIRPVERLAELSSNELEDFAEVLEEMLIRYDNLWQMPFPYVMVLHHAPTDGREHPGFHFHIEFHPPLRKPDLLKHLAGPEIGGGSFLSDTWPEDKAAELRAVPTKHYLDA